MKYLNKNKKEIVIETSWDDGHVLDLRLSKILKDNGLPGIFYVPTKVRGRNGVKGLSNQELKTLSQYFEIGSHTVSHPLLTEIDTDIVRYELIRSKEWLDNFLGKEVKSFCYPRGYHNDKIREIVQQCGYIEARTTKRILDNTFPGNPFKKHTTIHIYPHTDEYQGLEWYQKGKELIDKVISDGGYFHIWGHSWEIEKFNYWNDVEDFFKYVSEQVSRNLIVDKSS